MKKLLIVIISSILLIGCTTEEYSKVDKRQPTKYTLEVKYSHNNNIDTIQIESFDEPRLFIDGNVSTLISDRHYCPHASNVRSFKIIK